MKKKLIALLCAVSMLAVNIAALAQDAEALSDEAAEAAVTTSAEEAEEASATEEEAAPDEIAAEEAEDIIEETEAIEDNVLEETEAAEAVEEKSEEIEAAVEAEVLEETAEIDDEEDEAEVLDTAIADKSELNTLISKAAAVQAANLTDASAFDAFAAEITAAQGVASDASADQAAVDSAARDLELAIAEVLKSVKPELVTDSIMQDLRDGLFAQLKVAESADENFSKPDTYTALMATYETAKVKYWDVNATADELYKNTVLVKHAYDAIVMLPVTEKILSGNIKTEADKLEYPGMTADTLPDLSYTWSQGYSAEPASQDTKNEKLLSGLKPIDGASYMCWGKWDYNGSKYIDFDLGEEAIITGVDFWERASANVADGGGGGKNYYSDKITILTSNDGINWTERGAQNTEWLTDASGAYVADPEHDTRISFDPVKCKYVRVDVYDSDGYQVMYSEVVIRGARIPQKATAEVVIDDIDYKAGGKRIISADGKNSVSVTGMVRNTTTEPKNVWVISAAYKDGDLIRAAMNDYTLDPMGSASFTNSIAKGAANDGVEIHTFVWDGMTTGNALSDIYLFGLGAPTTSTATGAEDAVFDIPNEKLTVVGTADKAAGKDVTVLVLKAGVTPADFETMTTVNKRKNLLYIGQTPVRADGGYAFEYSPSTTSDKYGNNNVYVTEPGEARKHYRPLFIDATGQSVVYTDFTNTTDMKTTLESNDFLYKGIQEMDDIIAKNGSEDAVLTSVANMLTRVTFDDANDIVVEILAAAALTEVNDASPLTDPTNDPTGALAAIDTIDRYAEELGLAENGIYKDLYCGAGYEDFKKEVSADLVGQSYTDINAFLSDFSEKVVVGLINDAPNYNDVMTILTANETYLEDLGFDFANYELLGDEAKVRVQQAVAATNTYTTLNDIMNVFNDKVANPGADTSYGDSYSPSTGGGGGGGSFISSTVTPIKGTTANDVSVFKDLESVGWARESILALHKKGIVSGMTATEYAPNENVTREQFAKMLVQAFDLYDSAAVSDFLDVPEGAWYNAYVASAKNAGIVNGITEDTFGVGENITRQDMAVMAYNALVAAGNKVVYDVDGIDKFTDDAEIADYAKEAVYGMRGNGIMQGRGDNEFQPNAYATRAEAARIVYMLIANQSV